MNKYHEAKPDSPWDQTDYIILIIGIFLGACCILFPAIKLVSPMWMLLALPVMAFTHKNIWWRHFEVCANHGCKMDARMGRQIVCPMCEREENQDWKNKLRDKEREERIAEVMEGIRRAQV